MPEFESSVYTAFSVYRIKDVYFSLNEELFADVIGKQVRFEVGQTIGTNRQHKLVNLTLRAYLHYHDSNDIIADIRVQNVFHVPDLEKHVQEDRLKLPTDTIVSMVSVSIAHTRALLAKNLSGTPLEKTLLPVVNPLVLSQHLFPALFSDAGLQRPKSASKKTKSNAIKSKQ